MVRILSLLFITLFVSESFGAQSYLAHRRAAFKKPPPPAGGGCTVTTNGLVVTHLASFGNTSNNNWYSSAAVTPSANATLVLFGAISPVGTENVVDNQAIPFTWWRAGQVSYNTIASPANELVAWVTQVPPWVTPAAFNVILTNTSGTGANLHLIEITGADTNKLWGTNAIVQTVTVVSNGTANPQITIAAPGGNGSNAVLIAFADDVNSAADSAAGNGQQELAETAYNTPATALASYYMTNAQSSQTLHTNIATARDWAALALEIRAGTNDCTTLVPQMWDSILNFETGSAGDLFTALTWTNSTVAGVNGVWSINAAAPHAYIHITNANFANSNFGASNSTVVYTGTGTRSLEVRHGVAAEVDNGLLSLPGSLGDVSNVTFFAYIKLHLHSSDFDLYFADYLVIEGLDNAYCVCQIQRSSGTRDIMAHSESNGVTMRGVPIQFETNTWYALMVLRSMLSSNCTVALWGPQTNGAPFYGRLVGVSVSGFGANKYAINAVKVGNNFPTGTGGVNPLIMENVLIRWTGNNNFFTLPFQ